MEQEKKKKSLSATALWFDFWTVVCFAAGLGCFYSVVLTMFGLLFFLVGMILPFIAIICAICALCQGKKQIGWRGIIEAVMAILIPVITVIVIVVLFRTGVAYIRFM